MDIKNLIDNPLLSLVGRFIPQAGKIIDFVRAHETVIVTAAPVVQAAIEEGQSVLKAVKDKAPKFAAAVADLIKLLPSTVELPRTGAAVVPTVHVENVARNLAGFHSMMPDEEKAWMDRTTPHNDPSHENSNVGSG